MRIGIIGAGNIGGTLARRVIPLGHDVTIANSRGPETLSELVCETGATAVYAADAARDAELVVLAIPEHNIADLPGGFFDHLPDSVPVIDTGNYYPRERDGRIEPIENGLAESRWVSEQLGRPVIKTFNTIMATHLLELGRPAGELDRIALPVAGDNEASKLIVMRLVDELGFDPVDGGGLDESWRQQPGSPIYLADLDASEAEAALEQAPRRREPQFSGTTQSPGSYTAPR